MSLEGSDMGGELVKESSLVNRLINLILRFGDFHNGSKLVPEMQKVGHFVWGEEG